MVRLIKQELRLFVMLLIFWIILSGEVDARQLISGIMSSMLAIGIYNWILRNSGAECVRWIPFRTLFHFGSILLLEIFQSAVRHLLRIIRGRGDTAVCRLQLAVEEELIITLIASAITLTPGTVTLDSDRTALTVLFYGDFPNQCPLDLVLMAERFQKPFANPGFNRQEGEHA